MPEIAALSSAKSNGSGTAGQQFAGQDYWVPWRKTYPRFPRVSLEQDQLSPLSELLSCRGSVRRFSGDEVSFRDLSALFSVCAIVDPVRAPERRSHASAGATFPIEAYVFAHRVEGLEQHHAYHLDLDTFSLEELWPTNAADKMVELVSPHIENPAATIVLTAVISRCEIRYRHKAAGFCQFEAGLVAQNIDLTATGLGLGLCMVGGFDGTYIRCQLDLPEDEFPIIALAIGKPDGQSGGN